MIDNDAWQQFEQDGYLTLGQVVSDAQMHKLQTRMDDIMIGRAPLQYDKMLMQLDSADGNYDSAGPQTRGFKGATLAYRKIEGLEFDPIFLEYMQLPLFEDICRRLYGDIAIASFRAMFMNKPAQQGTTLPMHQDRWQHLDRDPLLTVYTALDDATADNGCVEIVPGSHHTLLNPAHDSGFLTPAMAEEYADQAVPLTLKAGEAAILHNWTLHRSGINRTANPRRAFSTCLMDAATRINGTEKVASKSIIFGDGALNVA